ncbi:MAG: STAS domain-containing protein [Burkholderiales bacterium]|nr:STAS domain-containing protein [Burkholderiales bacterium]
MYKVAGELSQNTANEVVAAGIAAISAGESEFDLSGLARVDSSAVAVMIAWQRCALQQGKTLQFHAIPADLTSLVKLYGLAEQFQNAVPGRH